MCFILMSLYWRSYWSAPRYVRVPKETKHSSLHGLHKQWSFPNLTLLLSYFVHSKIIKQPIWRFIRTHIVTYTIQWYLSIPLKCKTFLTTQRWFRRRVGQIKAPSHLENLFAVSSTQQFAAPNHGHCVSSTRGLNMGLCHTLSSAAMLWRTTAIMWRWKWQEAALRPQQNFLLVHIHSSNFRLTLDTGQGGNDRVNKPTL